MLVGSLRQARSTYLPLYKRHVFGLWIQKVVKAPSTIQWKSLPQERKPFHTDPIISTEFI